MASTRSTLAFAGALLLCARMDVARADKCVGVKLRAVGARQAGQLRCLAKVAARGDSSRLAACQESVTSKFAAAFARAGSCPGTQSRCQVIADGCALAVTTVLTDAFPSRCESAKRKAAGTLARKELGCHAKAAKTGRAPKGACIEKARKRFDGAVRKAGTCPDGGAPRTVVEGECVAPAVVLDAKGLVTGACPSPAGTTSTTIGGGPLTTTSLRPTTSSTTSSSTTTSSSAATTSSTATTSSSSTVTSSTAATSTTTTTVPGTFTLTATASGFYDQTGLHEPGNYAVGWYVPGNDELRDYFVFDLSAVSGTVTSAFLRLTTAPPTFIRYGSNDPSETYTLFDVSTTLPTLTGGTGGVAAFADLGGGTSYGTLVATTAIGETVDVVLNAAGIAFLAGSTGEVAIGGAMTTLAQGATNEFLFNSTSASLTRQLIVTTE